MTEAELKTLLEQEFKDLATNFVDQDYTDGINAAERELSVTLPVTNVFQVEWMRRRAKRHMLYALMLSVSFKFRVEGFHLNQKFDHLKSLIAFEDKEWKIAFEENGDELSGANPFEFFGTKIDPGFQYEDLTGIDTTYDDTNSIILKPDDNS